jgi:hypothetical protein
LNCLLSSYPENGLKLYNSLDYWQCRELLDISSNGRINPEGKLQLLENEVFNTFLDKYSLSKFNWLTLDEPINLWNIKNRTEEIIG